MPRPRLTDEERAQRKRDNLAKVLAGRPNPTGQAGNFRMWRSIAEDVLRSLGGLGGFEAEPEQPQMKRRTKTGNPDLDIFGLSLNPTWAEIKTAYRRLMMEVHPDRGGKDLELAKAVNVAYARLRDRYGN